MTRRDALLRLTTIFSGTIFGANRFLSGTAQAADATESVSRHLSADDRALLNEIGETILPTTPDSAGARAADVASFMQEIVRDFYDDRECRIFQTGLVQLNDASRAQFSGRTFMTLSAPERHELLLVLDRTKPQPEYYRMIKQLTMWGYFSSEIGATQALAYNPVPGRFEGCITVEPGAKAWTD